jgi:hypothetical protein
MVMKWTDGTTHKDAAPTTPPSGSGSPIVKLLGLKKTFVMDFCTPIISFHYNQQFLVDDKPKTRSLIVREDPIRISDPEQLQVPPPRIEFFPYDIWPMPKPSMCSTDQKQWMARRQGAPPS